MSPKEPDSGKGKGREEDSTSHDKNETMGMTQKYLPAPGQERTFDDLYEVEEVVDEPVVMK